MPVDVKVCSQFKGLAIAPEDVQFGDAESKEILINNRGSISKVLIRRKSVTLTLRGISQTQAQPFIDELANLPNRLLRGAVQGEDITLAGQTIQDAILFNVTPSLAIEVAGQNIIESLQVEYHSQRFV